MRSMKSLSHHTVQRSQVKLKIWKFLFKMILLLAEASGHWSKREALADQNKCFLHIVSGSTFRQFDGISSKGAVHLNWSHQNHFPDWCVQYYFFSCLLTECHKYICEKNVGTFKLNVFLWCPLLYCRKQSLHQSSSYLSNFQVDNTLLQKPELLLFDNFNTSCICIWPEQRISLLQSHIFVLDRERENNKHLIQPLSMRQHWVENTKLEFPGNPMWPLTGNSNYAQVLLCACISTHVAHSDINPFKRSDMSYFSEVGRCLPGGAVSALRIKTDGGCKNPLCLSPTTERQGREKSVTLPTGGKKEQTEKGDSP